jgi:malonyl CoA-acyl carrier protein transacylase
MNALKRYLGNTNSDEVHDTDNENTNCQLDEILVEHRKWYDTLTQAKADRSYDNCAYCLGGSSR